MNRIKNILTVLADIAKTYDNNKAWTAVEFAQNVKVAYALKIQEKDILNRLAFIKDMASIQESSNNFDVNPFLQEIENTRCFEVLQLKEISLAAEEFGIRKLKTTRNGINAEFIIFPPIKKGN